MKYDEGVLRTESHHFYMGQHSAKGLNGMLRKKRPTQRILHAALGISTEAGELLDAVKKSLFYGKPLDRTNLIEELGDLEWYMAVLRDELGVTQEQVQAVNLAKLQIRYPERFTSEAATVRDLEAEREALEGN